VYSDRAPQRSTVLFLFAIGLMLLDVAIVRSDGSRDLAALVMIAACAIVVVAMRRRHLTEERR
jgi:heme/copper-type cytochrome/quinol oxidase subunit 4